MPDVWMFLALVACGALALGAPVETEPNSLDIIMTENKDYTEDLKLFEGDIVVDERVMNIIKGLIGGEGNQKTTRGVIAHDDNLWPEGRVPYEIASYVDDGVKSRIFKAINNWMKHTCLIFEPGTAEDVSRIMFVQDNGCWSSVGRIGGVQTLSVGESGSEGESCTAVGIIMHEIGHAIGFFHEQSRPDRDDYVTIHWEHIKPSAYSNFMKYSHSTIDSLGGEYDYDSLMHYSSLAFSADGEYSITRKFGDSSKLGQRDGLSPKDIKQANLLYKCPALVDILVTAFLIKNHYTMQCLAMAVCDGERCSQDEPGVHYKVIITACNADREEQYWMWSGDHQLVHYSSLLCLSWDTGMEKVVLKNCHQYDVDQQWLCAGKNIQKLNDAKCIRAKNLLTDSNSIFLDPDFDPNAPVYSASLEACVSADLNQIWSKADPSVSICMGAEENMATRCYVEDLVAVRGQWTLCQRLGYYTSKIYHTVQGGIKSVTGLECCASEHVFAGETNGVTVTLDSETCSTVEWMSSGFECPEGAFLKGFYVTGNVNSAHEDIVSVKCCKPSVPGTDGYSNCHSNGLHHVANTVAHKCKLVGYFITGSTLLCDKPTATCEETLTCCQ